MFVNVQGGTGAGRKHRPDSTVTRCAECDAFVSAARAEQGATLCVRCEHGEAA